MWRVGRNNATFDLSILHTYIHESPFSPDTYMSNFCTPAFLYFVVSTLGILGSLFMGGSAATIIMGFLWVVLFSYLMNWLCSKGYNMVSWVLVALPMLLSVFMLMLMIANKTKGSSSPGSSPGTPPPPP
jgi:hypothetical protein